MPADRAGTVRRMSGRLPRANRSTPRVPTRSGGAAWFRGPFARWPRAADAVLAVAVFLAAVFLVEGPGDSLDIRALGTVPIPALGVFAVGGAALYWRRRAPVAVLGVVVVAFAMTIGTGYTDLGLAVIVALYSLGRHAAGSRWGHLEVAAAVVLLGVDGLTDSTPVADVVLGAVIMVAAWYVGRRLRLRSERAAQLARDRAAEARRIVTEERARIARELHDVVAHRVSLMTVQAGAAKAVAAQDPDGARQAMGAVEEAGRQALDELRHLLGVLRPEADPDGLGPQPGLADLPRLVDQISAAGLDVSLTTAGLPIPLPARVELSAYRIVQEALTNALKHGGPRTRAEVRLRGDADGVTVEVLDDGRGVPSPPDAPNAATVGHGLVGMRERVQLLGGHLEAGPRTGRGFRVVARLPTRAEPG